MRREWHNKEAKKRVGEIVELKRKQTFPKRKIAKTQKAVRLLRYYKVGRPVLLLGLLGYFEALFEGPHC